MVSICTCHQFQQNGFLSLISPLSICFFAPSALSTVLLVFVLTMKWQRPPLFEEVAGAAAIHACTDVHVLVASVKRWCRIVHMRMYPSRVHRVPFSSANWVSGLILTCEADFFFVISVSVCVWHLWLKRLWIFVTKMLCRNLHTNTWWGLRLTPRERVRRYGKNKSWHLQTECGAVCFLSYFKGEASRVLKILLRRCVVEETEMQRARSEPCRARPAFPHHHQTLSLPPYSSFPLSPSHLSR